MNEHYQSPLQKTIDLGVRHVKGVSLFLLNFFCILAYTLIRSDL